MATIASRFNLNLSDILFKIFTSMVKGETQSQGFVVSLCYLLEQDNIKLVYDAKIQLIMLLNFSIIEAFKKKIFQLEPSCWLSK